MAATIKDIANETGLGLATISGYLNGTNVRPKNKILIENAIKKLGYIRNDYARGLKTHKSSTVGVLIPELANIFGTTIIGAMEDILRKKGYGIIVCDYGTDEKLESGSVKFLLSKMVDALVVVMPSSNNGGFLDAAIENHIPVVVVDRLIDRSDVVQIVINNREISKEVAQRLLDCGHRSIGIITGSQTIYTAYERHHGYMDALKKAGCYNKDYVYDGKLCVEGGYLAMKALAKEHPDVTALFVTNYEMTVGSIIAINEMGKVIGKDYSFVGFDNMGLSQVVTPKLATVNQPMEEMGVIAAEMLLKSIDSGSVVAQTITLRAKIEEGESIRNIL